MFKQLKFEKDEKLLFNWAIDEQGDRLRCVNDVFSRLKEVFLICSQPFYTLFSIDLIRGDLIDLGQTMKSLLFYLYLDKYSCTSFYTIFYMSLLWWNETDCFLMFF